MTMLCSKAVRLMSGLEQGRVLARHCLQAQARGDSYCQELCAVGEARRGLVGGCWRGLDWESAV